MKLTKESWIKIRKAHNLNMWSQSVIVLFVMWGIAFILAKATVGANLFDITAILFTILAMGFFLAGVGLAFYLYGQRYIEE